MKMYQFEYVVCGKGEFPYDMLRYDGSYPAYMIDADHIGRRSNDYRCVTLHAWHPNKDWNPEGERWKSFLWKVDEGSFKRWS